MTAVDVKTLRQGDTVLVRMTVGQAGYLRVAAYGGGVTTIGVDDSAIVSVEPRPLAVGDLVKDGGDGKWSGTIVAIDGCFAWVKLENGYKSVFRDDVVRA